MREEGRNQREGDPSHELPPPPSRRGGSHDSLGRLAGRGITALCRHEAAMCEGSGATLGLSAGQPPRCPYRNSHWAARCMRGKLANRPSGPL